VANWSEAAGQGAAADAGRFLPRPWRRGLAGALGIIGGALVVLALSSPAAAATYTTTCPTTPATYTGTDEAAAETNELRLESVQTCEALAERSEKVVSALETMIEDAGGPTPAQRVKIVGINIPPGAFDPRPAGFLPTFDPSLYSATDRTSADDNKVELRLSRAVTDPLSLMWTGVWVLCGIAICLLFAPLWHRVWNMWA
jgi:hypothetical protein